MKNGFQYQVVEASTHTHTATRNPAHTICCSKWRYVYHIYVEYVHLCSCMNEPALLTQKYTEALAEPCCTSDAAYEMPEG